MKKYLFVLLLLLNYGIASASENPLTNMAGDMAQGGINVALLILVPLGVIFGVIFFIKKH